MQKITNTTILYLKEKVKAGVDAVQLFDSWGGVLAPDDYRIFSWQYLNQIVEALAPLTKVIVFAKGCWYALPEMATSKAAALGVDWTCAPKTARQLTGGNKVLQGNFDPSQLLAPPAQIKKKVKEMIDVDEGIVSGWDDPGLSENAKKSAQKAFERILEIDKNLN